MEPLPSVGRDAKVKRRAMQPRRVGRHGPGAALALLLTVNAHGAAPIYGAVVHIANIAGFGEKPWLEGPLSWRIGDLVYGPLNVAAAIALWTKSHWGIVLFLIAVASQFVIYTIFIDHFAITPEHRKTIYGLLGTESVLVAGLLVVWLLKR